MCRWKEKYERYQRRYSDPYDEGRFPVERPHSDNYQRFPRRYSDPYDEGRSQYDEGRFQVERPHSDNYERYPRRYNDPYDEGRFQVERPHTDYCLAPVNHEGKNTTIIYNEIELKCAYNYTDIARKANYNNSHADIASSTGPNY